MLVHMTGSVSKKQFAKNLNYQHFILAAWLNKN